MTTSSTFPRSSVKTTEEAAERARRATLLDGVAVVWTDRSDGDFAVGSTADPVEAGSRLSAVAGRPVAWLRQVHGGRVVVVPGEGGRLPTGEHGDALVASDATALAVTTADCAPVALASPEGIVAAVHAGWRGLVAGVLEHAVTAMRRLGAGQVQAALGPCLHAECCEFGAADLALVADRLGGSVRVSLPGGRLALDLPAAVRAALAAVDVAVVHDAGVCTACAADRYFSHRARGEVQRHAMVTWRT